MMVPSGLFIPIAVLYWTIFTAVSSQNSPALVPSCNPNPCMHNGQCVSSNGHNFCRCDVGYVGSLCQFRDPCNPSPCQNGGSCNVIVNDLQGPRFTCNCPIGYTASLCEIPLPNACDRSPCLHHGTCQLITLNDSRCICPNGYTGPRCENFDHCALEPCKNGATCVTSPANGSSYQCRCASGFQGSVCTEDIDECSAAPRSPCVYGSCINLPGSYRCDCQQGYTGKDCDQIYVPCDPSPCQNGGQCIVFGQHKYMCHCAAGFTGKDCELNIDDCAGHLCQNGGKCVDGLNGYTCKCPANYRGQYCTDDVDECGENNYMCQNGGTCQNTIGGFRCNCVNGWEGKYCQINHDDCERQQCFNGGTCVDRVKAWTCNCAFGWTGLLCHLRDACISSPCQGRGKCDTDPVTGSYVCTCSAGFQGVDCSMDIDECANDNPCEHHGTCVNTPGSYKCECAPGWTGPFCDENVNECASHPCQNEATCLDDVGRFICVCRPGFTGVYCETNLNDKDCAAGPCSNGGRCRGEPSGGFKCDCPTGFTGDRCETNVNECLSNPCEHNATCVDGIGKFTCQCPPGFTGTYCETSIGDRACLSSPCLNGGRCRPTSDHYTCECAVGFEGDHCQVNLNECANNPCLNGATCKDGVNSYTCACVLGFSGRNCQNNDDDCAKRPCANGGTCVDGVNNFTCQCQHGFRGRNCELRDNLDGLYKEVEKQESAMCLQNNCEAKADNGICNPECNYYACGFDGDDCSAGTKPFSRCKTPCYCWHKFQNGACDPECNSEGCLFDGYDCASVKGEMCNPLYVGYCASHFRDGHCDSGCNTSGCNYDGGDCEPAQTQDHQQQLQGSIVMIITVEPEIFVNNSNRFLMIVGKLVDATVSIQKDDIGRLMIYRWNSRDGVDKSQPVSTSLVPEAALKRARRQSTSPSVPYLTGTLVVLTVDISRCVLAGRTDCFQEIISVADFLGAASAKEALKQTLGWDVYSISTAQEQTSAGGKPSITITITCVAVGLVLIFLLALVIVRQKRKIQAPLWVPDNYEGKLPATKIQKKSNNDNGISSFQRMAVANQYEQGADFKRASCARMTTRNDFCQGAASSICESEFGDYLNWNNECRPESYSQCSDNETYSTYAESRCTGTVEPSTLPRGSTIGPALIDGAKQHHSAEWTKEHKDAAVTPIEAYKAPTRENVNVKGPENITPLMAAVQGRNNEQHLVQVCSQLIERGASLNEQTITYKDTALTLAAKYCRPHLVRLMVQKGADTNLRDVRGLTALHHAVAVNSKEMVEALLECRETAVDAEDDDSVTPLISAAKLGTDPELLEVLINAGAKVTCKDKDGRTALHWAAAHDNAAAITLLVRKGADKDSQDDKEETPLFLAAKEGKVDAVTRLLELGANKDITDQMCRLPRDIAADRNHKSVVKFLDDPAALITAAQMANKAPFDRTGTLPHNMDRPRAPKPRPPKRTKSLRETPSNEKLTDADTGKKVTMAQKNQKQIAEQQAVTGTMWNVDAAQRQWPLATSVISPGNNNQCTPIVPSMQQHQNSSPPMIISPCYLEQQHAKTPSLPYRQQQMIHSFPQPHQDQRQMPPSACAFSPPPDATVCAPSTGTVSAVNYGYMPNDQGQRMGGVVEGMQYRGSPETGGNGNYYHRSPEAGTCYPPPSCGFSPPQVAAAGYSTVGSTYSYSSLDHNTPMMTDGNTYYHHQSPEDGTRYEYVKSPPPYPQPCYCNGCNNATMYA